MRPCIERSLARFGSRGTVSAKTAAFAIHGTGSSRTRTCGYRCSPVTSASIVRCSASGGGARPADPACGAMTARRFYEPFFGRGAFLFGRPNGSLLSACPCRERRCRNARGTCKRLRPTHRSNAVAPLCPPPSPSSIPKFIIAPYEQACRIPLSVRFSSATFPLAFTQNSRYY